MATAFLIRWYKSSGISGASPINYRTNYSYISNQIHSNTHKPNHIHINNDKNVPCALRIRKILLPVTLFTCAIPWESRRITPICEGVNPFLANLQMLSSTWNHKIKQNLIKNSKNIYIVVDNKGGMIYIWSGDLEPTRRSSLVRESRSWNTLTETTKNRGNRKCQIDAHKNEKKNGDSKERTTNPRLCMRPMMAELGLATGGLQWRLTLGCAEGFFWKLLLFFNLWRFTRVLLLLWAFRSPVFWVYWAGVNIVSYRRWAYLQPKSCKSV